jgi:hypothetical protein
MLLIGDIHINAKYKDKILSAVRDFINAHPEETNLIFMGDFVYHFSYDRTSLLEVYDLFLEYYLQGKNLYILAGNHDRLGNSFVFEEGKKAFQLLQAFNNSETVEGISQRVSGVFQQQIPEIHFITKPFLTQIEGKSICFLPHMLDIDFAEYPGIEHFQNTRYQEQLQTNNKNQILSAKLHVLIQYFTSPLMSSSRQASKEKIEDSE